MKTCCICLRDKPLAEFHRSRVPKGQRAARDERGISVSCLECTAAERAQLALAGKKKCTVCGEALEFSKFHKRKPSPDGLAYKCVGCTVAYKRRWDEMNPDAFRQWRGENVDRERERFRSYREKNKEHLAKKLAQWSIENRALVAAKGARRHAAKRQATPVWADQDAILEFYKESERLTRETGIKHEVDHIYPLQGKDVCGLHVEHNLQVLTKVENISKLNRPPEEHERRKRAVESIRKAA